MFENLNWGAVFDSVGSSLGRAASNIDWGRVGLGVAGQRMASQANERATSLAGEGALARIQAEERAADKRIAFEREAARERNAIAREGAILANTRLQRISDAAAPDLATGSAHFRNIVAQDPNELTPAQVIGLEDARRTIVRSPVFRTSGRGTTAAIADVERRVRAPALEANRTRQSDAARALLARGNQAVAAQTQQADVDLSTSRDAGAAMQQAEQASGAAVQSAGQVSGEALQGASNTAASGGLATTQSLVNVLGNIIAGEDKDRYKSRYRSTGGDL